MLFDDLPLLAKVLIAVMGPPIVTIFCWLVGPLLAGARRERDSDAKLDRVLVDASRSLHALRDRFSRYPFPYWKRPW